MLAIATAGTHLPISKCDVGRITGDSVDGVTTCRNFVKFAPCDRNDVDVSRWPDLLFAGYLMGEDKDCDLFTGTDAISYECVGSADRFVVRQLNATTLTAVGVTLGHTFGRQTAVPAVTTLEGPENGH